VGPQDRKQRRPAARPRTTAPVVEQGPQGRRSGTGRRALPPVDPDVPGRRGRSGLFQLRYRVPPVRSEEPGAILGQQRDLHPPDATGLRRRQRHRTDRRRPLDQPRHRPLRQRLAALVPGPGQRGDPAVQHRSRQSAHPAVALLPPALVALAALLGLWLWHVGLRQGPLQAPASRARRQLQEHLRASADFLLRRSGHEALLQALRQDILRRARKRHPGFERLGVAEQWQVLARL
ncbi:hypothetical protein, partial [Pseudomonas sp. FEN]